MKWSLPLCTIDTDIFRLQKNSHCFISLLLFILQAATPNHSLTFFIASSFWWTNACNNWLLCYPSQSLQQASCRKSQNTKSSALAPGGLWKARRKPPNMDVRHRQRVNKAPSRARERVVWSRCRARSRRQSEIIPASAAKSHRGASEKPTRQQDLIGRSRWKTQVRRPDENWQRLEGHEKWQISAIDAQELSDSRAGAGSTAEYGSHICVGPVGSIRESYRNGQRNKKPALDNWNHVNEASSPSADGYYSRYPTSSMSRPRLSHFPRC